MLSKCHNSVERFLNHKAYGGVGSQLASLSPDCSPQRRSASVYTHRQNWAAGKHSPLKETTRMFTQAESPRSASFWARPILTACRFAGANGNTVFCHAEPMAGWRCRLWATDRAGLPVTMQQQAARVHVGVWSYAAAQLPLSLPCSRLEAEQKYERMGSTWGESYGCGSEPAAPSATNCTKEKWPSAFFSGAAWQITHTEINTSREGFKHDKKDKTRTQSDSIFLDATSLNVNT